MAKVMSKSELIDELTKRGIAHDPNAKNADLKALFDGSPVLLEEFDPEVAEEVVAEKKTVIVKKTKAPTGDPDVEVKPGQEKKVLDIDPKEREIMELQKDNRLVGWNPVTREAVFWKR